MKSEMPGDKKQDWGPLEEASAEADLLLCEATYGENEQGELAAEHGHMTFAQAAGLAADAKAKRLWLMHYSQMIEGSEEYLPNAQSVFPEAECGFDGKKITIAFRDQGGMRFENLSWQAESSRSIRVCRIR